MNKLNEERLKDSISLVDLDQSIKIEMMSLLL